MNCDKDVYWITEELREIEGFSSYIVNRLGLVRKAIVFNRRCYCSRFSHVT